MTAQPPIQVSCPAKGLRRCLELKARDLDPAGTLERCRALGATDLGVIEQTDTYFGVSHNRLMLRMQSPGRPHLLQNERAEPGQPRVSACRAVTVLEADGLRELLGCALGVHLVVAKRRHLWHCRGAQIHLDEVQGLVRFVELGVVAAPESDLSAEQALVAELQEALGIEAHQLCGYRYPELVLESRRAGAASRSAARPG